jgi:hypothetical protein
MSKKLNKRKGESRPRPHEVPVKDLFDPPVIRDTSVNEIDPKFAEASIISATANWSGTIQSAGSNAITQGVTSSQRVGDAVHVKGWDLRYRVFPNATADTVRVIGFIWNQSSGVAAPTVSDVLSASYLGAAYAPEAPYNFTAASNRKFSILFDNVHCMPPSGISSSAVAVHKRIPLNTEISFESAASTGSGHLYLVYIGTTAATGASMYAASRVFYSDV